MYPSWPRDGELVGDGGALAGEAMAAGAGRGLGVGGVDVLGAGGENLLYLAVEGGVGCLQRGDAVGGGQKVLFRYGELAGGDGACALAIGVGLGLDVEGLGALGVVAVDGDGLDAQTPCLHVGLGDVVDGAVLRAG